MKIISRYLFKHIVHYAGLFLLLCIAIMVVYEVFDTREEFLAESLPVGSIVLFLIYTIPSSVTLTLPMVGLLGSMMAYGLLAKHREILAMTAAGLSHRGLAIPPLLFGVCLSLFALWFNETVVPAATARANYLEKVTISGKSETVFTKQRNLFVKGIGSRFYFMQEYLPGRGEMVYPTILELSPNGGMIAERIEAERARLTIDPSGRQFWEFVGAEQWRYAGDGTLASYQRYDGPFLLPMEDDLDKFLSKNKKPEEMNLAELIDYVTLLRNRGGEKVDRYATSMHKKMAFPVCCLLMSLLGFVCVLDLHARHFVRGVLTGLGVAMGYYVVDALMSSLGDDGIVAPAIAGWTPVAIFALVILLRMHRLERQAR
jgi:lipopolysaccharide export system permease protein